MSGLIGKVDDDNFLEVVESSDVPVLVDFWAEWCGPCKMLSPVLEQIAAEFEGRLKVVKLNIDESSLTPRRYGVRSVPTLMIFENGEISATKIGFLSRPQLQAFVSNVVG